MTEEEIKAEPAEAVVIYFSYEYKCFKQRRLVIFLWVHHSFIIFFLNPLSSHSLSQSIPNSQ